MVEGIGRGIGQAIIALAVIAFVTGIASVGIGWAFWHFVFSHMHFAWR